MINKTLILFIGFLAGSVVTYFYQGKKLEEMRLALGVFQITSFEASHYLEKESGSDEKSYCFRYGMARSWADGIEKNIASNGYFFKSLEETAKELIQKLQKVEQNGLRYECKNI